MSSMCSIDDKKENSLMVIWDLGRRCTYSCSYCPPHRKNNWSPTASLEELISTAKNLNTYHEIYNRSRSTPFQLNASFSGGEPTVNPAFFDFLTHLHTEYPDWNTTLTTNGFYTERKLRTVMENTNFTTLSYHCEATQEQKSIVRNNIKVMHEEKYPFKVNVMFHAREEYFNECIELCQWLDSLGVKYTPRVIGDQGEVKEGIQDNTVHVYSKTQMEWFKSYWDVKNSATVTNTEDGVIGQSLGRPCCGGRSMDIEYSDGTTSKSKFIIGNNFQGWKCMINWYFLYIHQEIDQIWHHQTCQVNMANEVGPMCKVSELDKYNIELDQMMKHGYLPYITCPKTYCGCGLCVPKAADEARAIQIFRNHTKQILPVLDDPITFSKKRGTLRMLVEEHDDRNGNAKY